MDVLALLGKLHGFAYIDVFRLPRLLGVLDLLFEAFDMGVNCAPVHLDGSNAQEVAEGLRRFPERGMNQLQVRFVAGDAAEYCDQVERFGAEVAPHLAG